MNDILITKLDNAMKQVSNAGLLMAEVQEKLASSGSAVARSYAKLAVEDLVRVTALIAAAMNALEATHDSR